MVRSCGGFHSLHLWAAAAYLIGGVMVTVWIPVWLDADDGFAKLTMGTGFTGSNGQLFEWSHRYRYIYMAVVPFYGGFLHHLVAGAAHTWYDGYVVLGLNPTRWVESVFGNGAILWLWLASIGVTEIWNLCLTTMIYAAVCYTGISKEYSKALKEIHEGKRADASGISVPAVDAVRMRALREQSDNDYEANTLLGNARTLATYAHRRSTKWHVVWSWFLWVVILMNAWTHTALFLDHKGSNEKFHDGALWWLAVSVTAMFLFHEIMHTLFILGVGPFLKGSIYGNSASGRYHWVERAYLIANLFFRPAIILSMLAFYQTDEQSSISG